MKRPEDGIALKRYMSSQKKGKKKIRMLTGSKIIKTYYCAKKISSADEMMSICFIIVESH